jgi:hypothetical protein
MKFYNYKIFLITSIILSFVLASCGKKNQEKVDGKSTKKTSKWDKKDFERLSKLEIPGFKRLEQKTKSLMGVVSYYTGKKNAKGFHPFMWVILNECVFCSRKKMGDMKAWKKMQPNLNMMMSKSNKNNPNLVNKLEEMTLGNVKAMTLYTKSFVKTGSSTTSHHGLDVFYNNGINEIIIKVTARSKPYKSRKSLKDVEESLTKDEMIKAATAMLPSLVKEL